MTHLVPTSAFANLCPKPNSSRAYLNFLSISSSFSAFQHLNLASSIRSKVWHRNFSSFSTLFRNAFAISLLWFLTFFSVKRKILIPLYFSRTVNTSHPTLVIPVQFAVVCVSAILDFYNFQSR